MRVGSLPLLLLVALLVGGGYNYHRNAPLDRELEFRPYAGLKDADLAALLAVHRAKRDQIAASFGERGPEAGFAALAPSDYPGKVTAFERFQRENERWKQGRRDMLTQQTMVDALELEQRIRSEGLDQAWARILRRAVTL